MNLSTPKSTTVLLLLSILSCALSYSTAIVVARSLGVNGYDDYAVAISAALILATLAEMGTGKYAMRILPQFVENNQWSLAKGYYKFSFRLIFAVSIVLALFMAVSEWLKDDTFGNYALGIVILFLPIMAWVGAGAEFVIAQGAAIRSALVTRMIVPGSALAFVAAGSSMSSNFTAPMAALCFGASWIFGLVAISLILWRTTPSQIISATPELSQKTWVSNAFPFLLVALLLTLLARIGVVILEIVHPDEAVVAVYAAAFDTGAIIYIVAKSTDKLFLPRISLMIERKDVLGLRRTRMHRWLWMGIICAGYLLVIFIFGKRILSMFGDDFIEGYTALCIISVATAISTMASISPSYLGYVQLHAFVLVAIGLSVVAHIILCFPLGYRFGATGAAFSYALPVVTLYLTLMVVANRRLRLLAELNTTTPTSVNEEEGDESAV